VTLNPHSIAERLDEIDRDIAQRIPEVEDAARAWFVAKRDREREHALAFLQAEGTVAERKAIADRDHGTDGAEEEAEYEAQRAALRALETRGAIGMALLKSYGRQS